MVASIPNDIFQFSTYAAIKAGFNIGQPRTSDLTSHGSDGIGTYEDGSLMILLDKQAHQIRRDGTAVPAPLEAQLPFAMVTIFHPNYRIKVPDLTLESLEDMISSEDFGPARGINTLLPFKVVGEFVTVGLEDAGSISKATGTIFGVVVPAWMRDISGPRIHAHFLDEDEKKGGLVSEFEMRGEVTLGFARCGRFHLGFPQVPEWEDVKLSKR